MGTYHFILECEKVNEELKKDIEYYKRQNKRLKDKVEQLEKQNKEFKRLISYYYKYASEQEGKHVLAKSVTDWVKIWLREMLDNPNDNFSVVRVKDVLYKIEKLEREIKNVENKR